MKPNISNKAFWDTNFAKLDFVQNKNSIICRIFDHGSWNEVLEIWEYYGETTLKEALINAAYLREHSIKLACALFKLEPQRFKCYTKKQYHPTY